MVFNNLTSEIVVGNLSSEIVSNGCNSEIDFNGFNSKISHHEAKELSEIVMKRITYVPKELGADWRDIPNKEWKMSNGRVTPKLKYPYISAKTGKPAGIVSEFTMIT